MSTRINIIQGVAPDYRVGFFAELMSRGLVPLVWCGCACFSQTTTTSPLAYAYVSFLQNRYFFGRRFLWQSGILRLLLVPDPIVFNFNNRVISTTFLLLLRKCMGYKNVLWGHASGYGRFSRLLRIPQLLISDAFIAYTPTQRRELRSALRALGLYYPVYNANNACLSRKECWVAKNTQIDAIVYVGRLVEGKKPLLLLEAFATAVEGGDLPIDTRLLLVGEGPLRKLLQHRAEELGVQGKVDFLGHVTDVASLRFIYSRAICSVSAGYVGLSVTQSLAFGVPVAVADSEPHSPEIEACHFGLNSLAFRSDDKADLVRIMKSFSDNRNDWLAKRDEISRWTACTYSFESMADAFEAAFRSFRKCETGAIV